MDKSENELVDLIDEVHSKFHPICEILKKSKNKNKNHLIKLLESEKIFIDKITQGMDHEIFLDIGNGWIYSIIENEDRSKSDFTKYNFRITGIRDYQGLTLRFDYKTKKKSISLVDFKKTIFKSDGNTPLGKDSEKIYEELISKGGFDNERKSI
jgi:ribosomal protein S6E (S10)